ncbi:MAG: phosphoglycerate kinase [Bacteroidota bacterium]
MKLHFQDKKVLVRVDFNVPLNAAHHITDDTRMRKALPTIQHIRQAGGAVVLMSHLGRPQKKLRADGSLDVERFTLAHLREHLGQLLDTTVHFCPTTVGPQAQAAVAQLKRGEVLLLENTRFNAGETKGDPDLARQMAELGELYVNDAFGTAHREHASTATVAQHFAVGSKTFGFLMQAEITNANKVLNEPERPLTAIVGGAKVSDKILLLERLIGFVDHLIVGGGMAYTFVRAQGGQTGQSLVEEDKIDLAAQLLRQAADRGVAIHLPQDSVLADEFKADAQQKVAASNAIEAGWMGLDIGPQARQDFAEVLAQSKTILWNGPMGVFEMAAFAEGTQSVATAVAAATKHGAFSLVGGGDSVAAINQLGLADEVSYVSTGGGAMLEFLEGKELPGIKAMN